ncbi:hypothetical protein Tco_0019722 [Tanacetum coccineum]
MSSSSSSSSYYSNPNSALVPTECKCHLHLRQLTAWTKENPARRFLICPNRYKTEVKKCKKWVWLDLELENEWYRSHLYEMHRLLNYTQRQELSDELSSQEEVFILQVEMQQLKADLDKSEKSILLEVKFHHPLCYYGFGVLCNELGLVWVRFDKADELYFVTNQSVVCNEKSMVWNEKSVVCLNISTFMQNNLFCTHKHMMVWFALDCINIGWFGLHLTA